MIEHVQKNKTDNKVKLILIVQSKHRLPKIKGKSENKKNITFLPNKKENQ